MICSAFNLLYRPHNQENVLFHGLETYVHSHTHTTFPVSMCTVGFNDHLVSHVKIPYLGIQDPFLKFSPVDSPFMPRGLSLHRIFH